MTAPTCIRPNCLSAAVAGGGMCNGHRDAYIRRNYPDGYFTDATPVATHIAVLRDAGMTWDQIAFAATMTSPWGIRDIVAGRRKGGRVAVDTAEAIMSVPVPRPGDFTGRPDHALVPMIGSTRRVRALVALGHTNRYIAIHSDYPTEHLHRVLGGKADTLTLKAHRGIAALFDRLQTAPPPQGPAAKRARRRASERGWPPPLAWDEDTIDDPAARPYRPTAVRVTANERIDELRELGVHDINRIAERLGIQPKSVERQLHPSRYDIEQVAS